MAITATIDVSTNTPRRNSTGNPSTIQITKLPNYLRASISSCHDICKYGPKPPHLSPSPSAVREDKRGVIVLPKQITKKVAKGSSSFGKPIPQPVRKQTAESKSSRSNNTVRTSRDQTITDVKISRKSSSTLPRLSSSVKTTAAVKSKTIKSIPDKASSPSTTKSDVGKPPTQPSKSVDRDRHAIDQTDENRIDSEDEGTTGVSRREKVLPEEDDSPRKLSFRQPNMLDIHQIESVEPVGLMRTVSSDEKTQPTSHTITADLHHHPDMAQADKNSVLMNIVIEEAASKLARERMSKVKALVGAFESVIKICDSEISLRTSKML
ncbi:uncharacterized protein LOC127241334 [Andrographis paniculata]|uniref:uncharacterized protein LOC127241334 n=1 Tax=Andrographis paniculata TaxID=175694 RepID=UPI0021E9A1C4|nr:uncharacterized protein LOC127241334 [Andrographis paniculata]